MDPTLFDKNIQNFRHRLKNFSPSTDIWAGREIRPMSDRYRDQPPFEVLVIWRGLQFLTILTFAGFLGWAIWHLYKMFV
jgi:hypothetical protein